MRRGILRVISSIARLAVLCWVARLVKVNKLGGLTVCGLVGCWVIPTYTSKSFFVGLEAFHRLHNKIGPINLMVGDENQPIL